MKTKTTLSFTDEELDILYFALNAYSLEKMNESRTYGNAEALILHGGPDVWHRTANATGKIQSRVYYAQLRLAKKNAQTVNE